jgi:hypothetical protein
VNAAFLMLTTAWLAGADPVPVAPAPAAPVVANGSCCGGGSGCGGAADCGCDDGCGRRPGFFARLFAKKSNDCGCETSCQPSCQSSCDSCDSGRGKRAKRSRGSDCCESAPTCCAPAPAASTCCDDPCAGRSGRRGLLARLFSKRGGDCGCDSGCNSGCGTGCGGAAVGGSGCGGTNVITTPPTPGGSTPPPEAAPQPKPANPMPTKASPMTINGIYTPVTPVVSPF